MADITVPEPFPIFKNVNRFLLFDANTITYVRRVHHICGTLIGTVPSLKSQSQVLGAPIELLPEEARLLTVKGHAYIVDNVQTHEPLLDTISDEERNALRVMLDEQSLHIQEERRADSEKRKAHSLKMRPEQAMRKKLAEEKRANSAEVKEEVQTLEDGEGLFTPPSRSLSAKKSKPERYLFITPATSYPPLALPPVNFETPLPEVGSSYELYAHLHSKGYYMLPGLRFGCQYNVYPGDPLGFHSHFSATGLGWDEEFDLLTIIGGGRLGTAVKKAFLIGGAVSSSSSNDAATAEESGDDIVQMRTFSIEWAGI
jgi:tRNA-splicing endonuclease subunit Sen34